MTCIRHCIIALCVAGLTQTSFSQAEPAADSSKPDPLTILKGRPDTPGQELLGGTFQNPLAGIAFRVPARCQQVKASGGDEIARFADNDKTWEMIVNRASSSQPLPLTGDDKKLGLLEVIAARLKAINPSIQIARQETVHLGEYDAGVIAARFTSGSQRRLLQQAIIQANDQLYYTFALTTPAARDAAGDQNDPGQQVAVETFTQMLDTVKLLDRSTIKQDQNERLFRTRALFTLLTQKKLHDVLIPEQWMRLTKDGKDIGYTYIVEESESQGGHEGVKIGIRSRTYPDASSQVDGETWFIVSGDRRHESWSNLVWVQNLAKKTSDQFTETGVSDRRTKRSVDNNLQPGDATDPKQPPVVTAETATLEVKSVGQTGNPEPLTRSLPPFYLPQAVGHLLPRLLPLREPKTFLFATYVSDRREVMMRYVDVGREQEVELNGQRVRAVPISDRIGLEGSSTVHYMSPEGQYLGSVNKDSKITIIPTDAATLQQLWANKAVLTRPKEQPAQ